jgi:phage terminase Nu1 subunit (DNA packaging protein)
MATKDPGSVSKRSPLLTRRELALVLGVHMQTVTKWERDGLPVANRGRRGKPSTYRESDVRAWLKSREVAAQSGQANDVARERARKERAQALEAEQRVAFRARELLPAEEVEKAWTAEASAVRAILLASYTTHADRVYRAATLDGLAGVERVMKDVAHEALRELANPERPLPGEAA